MNTTWKLRRTVQCEKCPWKKTTNPHDIPNGYDVEKHKALADTIAQPGDISGLFDSELRVMACHETHADPCIGWLIHQLGPGQNIPLRLHCYSCENIGEARTVGEQHRTFEETYQAGG